MSLTALRIHISKPCYIGLLEIGGYEMTLRGEMNVKVGLYRYNGCVLFQNLDRSKFVIGENGVIPAPLDIS